MKKVPQDMFVLLNLPGVGAKTAYKLAKALKTDRKSKPNEVLKSIRKSNKKT